MNACVYISKSVYICRFAILLGSVGTCSWWWTRYTTQWFGLMLVELMNTGGGSGGGGGERKGTRTQSL